jgi:hypothetical protein
MFDTRKLAGLVIRTLCVAGAMTGPSGWKAITEASSVWDAARAKTRAAPQAELS